MSEGCLACELMDGSLDLPGGVIYSSALWRVEHSVGPLGVGTLIVKPIRHCTHLWELTTDEITEMGPIIHSVATVIHQLLQPDQVYSCLWSHAGWEPGHIHFVLQPVSNDDQAQYPHPGPFMQAKMFTENAPSDRQEVEKFAALARDELGHRLQGSGSD